MNALTTVLVVYDGMEIKTFSISQAPQNQLHTHLQKAKMDVAIESASDLETFPQSENKAKGGRDV
ncbi:hypothetical protein JI735_25150 [Paenibacillus sonchi]|uniref:Uncharacterized protein n=1 Tax=Paenibacillus sonchi TaxID=373687 RepID=A0A974P9H7_9BACL|nr:hypothetical protein [Paenibacillus sonchi]QQZ59849.1 hypothetical protein JI735_25150 [Paenibacillus sonchi]